MASRPCSVRAVVERAIGNVLTCLDLLRYLAAQLEPDAVTLDDVHAPPDILALLETDTRRLREELVLLLAQGEK